MYGAGFPEPATASRPSAGTSLYFEADRSVPNPGKTGTTGNNPFGNPIEGQSTPPAPLLFGSGSESVSGSGEPIVNTARAPKGHVSEVLNFHGSPAPWILIGLLLAAGLLHLSASGRAGFKGTL